MIPLFKPNLGQEELTNIGKAFERGWVANGPLTKEFEEKFAARIGVKHAVALNSGTAALHLALLGLNIRSGEVLTTPLTFVSTNHAIVLNRADPVFTDIEPDTLNVSVDDLKKKISSKTKAILVVHFGGHACDMDPIFELARQYSIPVIEDAAHAVGSLYKDQKIGSLKSAATCFSFHAVKNMTTGDGGMVTTNDDALAGRLRRLRWLGIDKEAWLRTASDKPYGWNYCVEEFGYKYHMNDLSAAIGLAQLEKLDSFNKKRRKLFETYQKEFQRLPEVGTPVEKEYARCAFHNYVIKVERRDELSDFLQTKGIASGVHYMPNHLHPCYKKFSANVPVTDRVWKKLLTIPFFPDMTETDVKTVVSSIADFLAQKKAGRL